MIWNLVTFSDHRAVVVMLTYILVPLIQDVIKLQRSALFIFEHYINAHFMIFTLILCIQMIQILIVHYTVAIYIYI